MSHTRRYVLLWATLLAALVVSLALGPLAGSRVVVALIFTVAAAKALLVVGWYMHLLAEPWFNKMIIGMAAAFVTVLFFGLVPDIVWVYGEMPAVAHASSEAVASTAAPAVPVPLPEPNPDRGAGVYTTYCAACHQADGRGMDGRIAADFVADPSRLARSDEELVAVISGGKRGVIGTMPPWQGVLTVQQQIDALHYIRREFGHSAGSP